MITGSTDLGKGLLFLTVNHDPTVTPTKAPLGSLIVYTVTGAWYHKDDNGSSTNVSPTGAGISGFSGFSSVSGYSGKSGVSGASGYSGVSGFSGTSGFSGFSAAGLSGTSGTSGTSGKSGTSGTSGFSGLSGFSGIGASGVSGFSGASGFSSFSGFSGTSGTSGFSGTSGTSGVSSYSGISGYSGTSGVSGFTGTSGWSGISASGGIGTSGFSGFSGFSGISADQSDGVIQGYMERTHMIMQASGFSAGSGFAFIGANSGFSSLGTNIHNFPDFGNGVMYSAANTSGQKAGVFGFLTTGGMITMVNWKPIQVTSMWTGVSTNDLQHVRIYVGLVKNGAALPGATDTAATIAATPMLAFRYCPDGGVDTANQWSVVTSDGTTLNVITGVAAIALNTSYNLRIDTNKTAGTALFYINDVQVASTTLNLPSGSTQLQPICLLTTTNTTQGSIALKKIHISQI